MDPKQRAHILKSLFKIPIDEIGDKLILELKFISDRIDEVYWGQKLRHRIFIKNAKIINSGNSNIKFKMNPVSYIR
jgi:hypothetical protein